MCYIFVGGLPRAHPIFWTSIYSGMKCHKGSSPDWSISGLLHYPLATLTQGYCSKLPPFQPIKLWWNRFALIRQRNRISWAHFALQTPNIDVIIGKWSRVWWGRFCLAGKTDAALSRHAGLMHHLDAMQPSIGDKTHTHTQAQNHSANYHNNNYAQCVEKKEEGRRRKKCNKKNIFFFKFGPKK